MIQVKLLSLFIDFELIYSEYHPSKIQNKEIYMLPESLQ